MCGIVAVLGLQDAPVDDLTNAEQVRAGLDRLEHRGPDGRGVWQSLDGRCGEWHRDRSDRFRALALIKAFHDSSGTLSTLHQ